MIPNQVLQRTLEDFHNIAKHNMMLLDNQGFSIASTLEEEQERKISALIQEFIDSQAQMQEMQGFYFFKIVDGSNLAYLLVTEGEGENARAMGQLLMSQVQILLGAYQERTDKGTFMQNLLMDNLLLVDIYNRAKKLHIAVEAKRVVFIIETQYEKDDIALETIKSIFAARPKDYVTAIDERNIIIIKELKNGQDAKDIEDVAKMLLDMLNAEAMSKVRVAFGNPIYEIKDVSKSYKEAKMALDVGNIFYAEKNIIAYNALGIGRLIYQLPLPLCKLFIKEIFGQELPEAFDEETATTINKFFENSLNVSETARQLYVHRNTLVYRLEKLQKTSGLDIKVFEDALTFKIAMMVVNYIKYLEQQE